MSLMIGLEKNASLGRALGSLARKSGQAASTVAKVPFNAAQAAMASRPVQGSIRAAGTALRGVAEGASRTVKGVASGAGKIIDVATAGNVRKGLRQGYYRPGNLNPQRGSLGRDTSSVGNSLVSRRINKLPESVMKGRSPEELEALQNSIGAKAKKDVFDRANKMRSAKGQAPISEATLGPRRNEVIGASVADRRIAKQQASGKNLSSTDKSRIESKTQADVINRAKRINLIRNGSFAARHPLMAGTGLALAGYTMFGGPSQAPQQPSVFNSYQ